VPPRGIDSQERSSSMAWAIARSRSTTRGTPGARALLQGREQDRIHLSAAPDHQAAKRAQVAIEFGSRFDPVREGSP
jgi:hypothetical protein